MVVIAIWLMSFWMNTWIIGKKIWNNSEWINLVWAWFHQPTPFDILPPLIFVLNYFPLKKNFDFGTVVSRKNHWFCKFWALQNSIDPVCDVLDLLIFCQSKIFKNSKNPFPPLWGWPKTLACRSWVNRKKGRPGQNFNNDDQFGAS